MRYVLDASVAVAALRTSEPAHEAALHRCLATFTGADEIVVPAIFDIEVTSALVRRGAAPESVARFFDTHFVGRKIVTIGPRAAKSVCQVVARTRLRAADALYVWLAVREGIPLVTLDQEVLEKAPLVGALVTLP